MTKYFLIITVVLIAQGCSIEKNENDWSKDNLQGRVLSYSQISYEAIERFGIIEKGKRNFRKKHSEEDYQKKYDLREMWLKKKGLIQMEA